MDFKWLAKQASTKLARVSERLNALLDDLAGDVEDDRAPVAGSVESFDPSVTNSVIEFAEGLADHPHTFSMPLANVADPEAFRLTRAQEWHARTILARSPALSSLRYTICPRTVSDARFWCVYFTLLGNQARRKHTPAVAIKTTTSTNSAASLSVTSTDIPSSQSQAHADEAVAGSSSDTHPSQSSRPAGLASMLIRDCLPQENTRTLSTDEDEAYFASSSADERTAASSFNGQLVSQPLVTEDAQLQPDNAGLRAVAPYHTVAASTIPDDPSSYADDRNDVEVNVTSNGDVIAAMPSSITSTVSLQEVKTVDVDFHYSNAPPPAPSPALAPPAIPMQSSSWLHANPDEPILSVEEPADASVDDDLDAVLVSSDDAQRLPSRAPSKQHPSSSWFPFL